MQRRSVLVRCFVVASMGTGVARYIESSNAVLKNILGTSSCL